MVITGWESVYSNFLKVRKPQEIGRLLPKVKASAINYRELVGAIVETLLRRRPKSEMVLV